MKLGEDSVFPAHEFAMPGDRASEFENAALPHAASLLRYARHLAGEKGRAEDLVQEARTDPLPQEMNLPGTCIAPVLAAQSSLHSCGPVLP